MRFSTFSTGFSTMDRRRPYTHRNPGRKLLETFGQKCGHSAFYKKESRSIFFVFYKPPLPGRFGFSNLESNGRKFSTSGPARFYVWKRRGKMQFSTLFLSRLNPLSRLRRQLPRGGSFFAITETYRMNAKSFRQCYKLPLRGSWLRPTGAD